MATKLNPIANAASREHRSWPIAPEEVQRILVIRPGGLGDAVLTYPMIHALRRGYSNARTDVLVEKRNSSVYEITDVVDEIHRYDAGVFDVRRRLRNMQYDIIIDTEQYHHFSTIFANLLRPKYLCGFDTLGRRRFQTHSVPYSEETYEIDSFLGLAEAVLGSVYEFDPNRPFIDVKPAAQFWAEETVKAAGQRPVVVVAPGASGFSRIWPLARYAELVRWLTSREYYVVLVGGQDGVDAARDIATDINSETVLNLTGKTSVAQSAAVLQQSRLSVSADTGVMHLAYAVGTPTVSIFGSGLHQKWGPPGRDHRIVRKGLPCSPCIRFGRLPPCPHNIACMRELSAADVIAAIEDLFDS
jgi:lipopolysaccharide heptosyltransferase II